MAVSDGDLITVVKDMGLVSHVFDERTLAPLTGHLAIGHTRYSTTGSSTWRNAQPVYRGGGATQFALGHNGNLVNTGRLADEAGMLPGMVAGDSDLVAELLEHDLEHDVGSDGEPTLVEALSEVLPRPEGALSFVLLAQEQETGGRVHYGLRPPCLVPLVHSWRCPR